MNNRQRSPRVGHVVEKALEASDWMMSCNDVVDDVMIQNMITEIISQSSVHYTTPPQCLTTRVWRGTEGSGHVDQSGLFDMVVRLGVQFVGWDASCRYQDERV